MMTRLKLFPTLLLLFMAQLAWATDGGTFEIKVLDENSFLFSLEASTTETIEISIRDEFGQVFHSETVKNSKVEAKKYNLKQLPEGNYNFLVMYDQHIKIQEIAKNSEGIQINAEAMKTVYFPTFVEKAGYLDMDIFCNPEVEYYIQIQDKENNTLYDEKIDAAVNVQRRFNLTKLEAGEYEVVVQLRSNFFRELHTKKVVVSPSIVAVN